MRQIHNSNRFYYSDIVRVPVNKKWKMFLKCCSLVVNTSTVVTVLQFDIENMKAYVRRFTFTQTASVYMWAKVSKQLCCTYKCNVCMSSIHLMAKKQLLLIYIHIKSIENIAIRFIQYINTDFLFYRNMRLWCSCVTFRTTSMIVKIEK